jgi:hypothetical protein
MVTVLWMRYRRKDGGFFIDDMSRNERDIWSNRCTDGWIIILGKYNCIVVLEY